MNDELGGNHCALIEVFSEHFVGVTEVTHDTLQSG
jgi:hypothetical protein